MSENTEYDFDNGLTALAHEHGLKVYHCGDSICITKSCKKGHEIKNIRSGGQQYFGTGHNMIPTIKNHIFYYMDGTAKIIESFSNILYNECDEVEPID